MPNLHGRENRRMWLESIGFLPEEAVEFSKISVGGLRAARYNRYMLRSRRMLSLNAKRYEWTREHYERAIQARYEKAGAIKPDGTLDPWSYLRYLEEQGYGRGDEYTSPWRKRTKVKAERKQEVKRVTRRQMIEQQINQTSVQIERARNDYQRQQLINKRAELQRQLDYYL